MHEFIQYTILGLVLGGIYGIAASGLVLTCTTSGIFNFGHGSIAMLSAFVYWQVPVGWDLVRPPGGMGWGPPPPPAGSTTSSAAPARSASPAAGSPTTSCSRWAWPW